MFPSVIPLTLKHQTYPESCSSYHHKSVIAPKTVIKKNIPWCWTDCESSSVDVLHPAVGNGPFTLWKSSVSAVLKLFNAPRNGAVRKSSVRPFAAASVSAVTQAASSEPLRPLRRSLCLSLASIGVHTGTFYHAWFVPASPGLWSAVVRSAFSYLWLQFWNVGQDFDRCNVCSSVFSYFLPCY